jgi:hypothetical protein
MADLPDVVAPNLADVDFEPSDAELHRLMERAWTSAAAQHAAAAEALGRRIADDTAAPKAKRKE